MIGVVGMSTFFVHSVLLPISDRLDMAPIKTPGNQACPITRKKLPKDKLDVAVVYGVAVPSAHMQCGHACTIGALLDMIEESKGPVKCPECETSFVISVCDGLAAEKLCTSCDSNVALCDLISFRYGPYVYWLSVPDSTTLAQERIAQVLGIPETDLRILYRGKQVFPDSEKQPNQVSNCLLDISKGESGKKPSMVIMGKRTGRWGAQGGHLHR